MLLRRKNQTRSKSDIIQEGLCQNCIKRVKSGVKKRENTFFVKIRPVFGVETTFLWNMAKIGVISSISYP